MSAKQRVNIDSFFATLVRAVARSKRLHRDYVETECRGKVDDGLFNGNVAVVEREQEAQKARDRSGGANTPTGSGGGGVRYGKDAEKEKQKALASRGTRNPSLAMDRRRSLSVGGLGGDPDGLGRRDGHAKGCGCTVS